MAQSRLSKFFRSGMVSPFSVRKLNLHPKRCMPRILQRKMKCRHVNLDVCINTPHFIARKKPEERQVGKVLNLFSPYLKVKMKSMRSMQKVATLSIVFISTTSCLLRAGRKRTSFRTRSRRNVRRTDSPPSAWPIISHTLRTTHNKVLKYWTTSVMHALMLSAVYVNLFVKKHINKTRGQTSTKAAHFPAVLKVAEISIASIPMAVLISG